MSKLVSNAQLTPDGRDWLTLALDPFHDNNHQAAGYPDADASQTIVSCYQYQLDLAKPAGVAGPWDCNIFTTPLAASGNYFGATENATWSKLKTPALASNAVMGPLTIYSGVAGSNLNPEIPLLAGHTSQCLPAVGTLDVYSGVTRIIGMGFEVTNTTADIYRQGAVTVYRMPQYRGQIGQTMLENAAATKDMPFTYERIRKPPSSIAQVNLLKGTKTWAAKDGVYAVATQNSMLNPLVGASPTLIVAGSTSAPDGVSTLSALHSDYVDEAISAAPIPSVSIPKLQKVTPFDTTGAYFTGLSEQTTMTIKLKIYVERAPTQSEPSIAVLATPSAGLDEKAMQLYSHTITQLPVAVPVGENALGDWFRTVLNVVKTVAGGAAGVLGAVVPGAQQIGTGVQTIAGALEQAIRPKIPRPPPPPRPAKQQQKRKNAK